MQRFIQNNNLSDDDYIYYNFEGSEYTIHRLDYLHVLDWKDMSFKIRTKHDHVFWLHLPYLSYGCKISLH